MGIALSFGDLALARALRPAERRRIRAHVGALLAWQRTLRDWPSGGVALDALPFVSVYARGELRGCFGCSEGAPRERLTRAFLRALEDGRHGLVRADERAQLAATVSYLRAARPIDPAQVDAELDAGREGLAVVQAGGARALLLPHVARDLCARPREFLVHLGEKARLSAWTGTSLYAFRTEDVVVRMPDDARRRDSPDPPARRARPRRRDRRDLAAAWLTRLVDRDGAVTFSIDARKRERAETGLMHHGRAAVVMRALEEHTPGSRVAARARTWLRNAIERALRGERVPGWPEDRAMAAGTLALATMAGVDHSRELREMANEDPVLGSPWHAAQVVTALGVVAPEGLWRACTNDLARRPWAPWTVLAARARGDGAVARDGSRTLAASLSNGPPGDGGCRVNAVPETAVTALVVEALSTCDAPEARAAVARGQGFLERLQLLGESIPASLDPELAEGAFPASPIVDGLRCDVVAHALLALA